jgi:hypothetical protein
MGIYAMYINTKNVVERYIYSYDITYTIASNFKRP